MCMPRYSQKNCLTMCARLHGRHGAIVCVGDMVQSCAWETWCNRVRGRHGAIVCVGDKRTLRFRFPVCSEPHTGSVCCCDSSAAPTEAAMCPSRHVITCRVIAQKMRPTQHPTASRAHACSNVAVSAYLVLAAAYPKVAGARRIARFFRASP